jgi:hypothetical protein
MPAKPLASTSMRGLAAALVLVGNILLVGCSGGPPAFCDDLEDWVTFDDLNAAIVAGDSEAAEEQMSMLEELASSAPSEIAADMAEVSATMTDVVALGLSTTGSTEDELERERVNRRLAGVVEHTTSVAAWAERECGLRLD